MFRFLLRLFIVAIILLIGFLAYGLFLPIGPESQALVQLKPGSSARRIAADLKKAGVIRSESAFLFWRYLKRDKSLKAGEYAFDHPANAMEVFDRIARGDIYFHTVVVPEGFNIFDIATTLETAGLGSKDQFLEAARNSTMIRDLDPQAPSLEGYLFPDTYHFTRTQSARDIFGTMVHRFRQATREIGLTSNFHQVVTMASIVEKETGASEERPIVASVFNNRIARNMVLATDPAVIYAALLNNRYRGAIFQSDLQFDSPYNTYRHSGLPPGPICNPGKASLEAAMHPANTGFLFFVSNNEGHHRFARTEAEHAANVAAYRRAVGQGR